MARISALASEGKRAPTKVHNTNRIDLFIATSWRGTRWMARRARRGSWPHRMRVAGGTLRLFAKRVKGEKFAIRRMDSDRFRSNLAHGPEGRSHSRQSRSAAPARATRRARDR